MNQIERLLMTSSRNRKSGKTTLLSDYLNNNLTENALVGFEQLVICPFISYQNFSFLAIKLRNTKKL